MTNNSKDKQNIFEVKSIVNYRIINNNKEFLIQWAGWERKENEVISFIFIL